MDPQDTGQTSDSELLVQTLGQSGDTIDNGRFVFREVPGYVYLRPRHAVLAAKTVNVTTLLSDTL